MFKIKYEVRPCKRTTEFAEVRVKCRKLDGYVVVGIIAYGPLLEAFEMLARSHYVYDTSMGDYARATELRNLMDVVYKFDRAAFGSEVK
jgi:hypothetical protein